MLNYLRNILIRFTLNIICLSVLDVMRRTVFNNILFSLNGNEKKTIKSILNIKLIPK